VESATVPHAELIRLYHPYIRHVHVNEMDGRYPGTGSYDFKPVFAALVESSYQDGLSLEVFDFRPDGVTIARESARVPALDLVVRRSFLYMIDNQCIQRSFARRQP